MEQITMVQVENLRPHEKNPRIDAATVADLVESIREHGIEVPLVATPAEGEGYVVLAGHRRLTAAHELVLTEVPVQIRTDLVSDREQLAFMATENIHRDQLTAVEESRLVQDMLDLGMSQADVAKQTALGKKRVSERVKLGKLAEQTGDKVHRGQITVDDALIIAEYSDDPDTAEQLENAAGTYNFDWTVSRAKAARETRKLQDDARKLAKKEGLRIADDDADFVRLSELVVEGWATPPLEKAAADEVSDDEWTAVMIAEHKDCPGHSCRLPRWGSNELHVGCDDVANQHGDLASTDTTTPEPEAEPDPLDHFTDEDLAAMRYDRESKIHTALTTADLTDWALGDLTDRAIAVFDRLDFGPGDEYRTAALGFLGLPPDATDATIAKTVRKLSWPSRYAFAQLARAAIMHHEPMSNNARSWMWGHPTNLVDEFMRALDVEPSDLEKELRTLHQNPWDSDEDGDALAEGGDPA